MESRVARHGGAGRARGVERAGLDGHGRGGHHHGGSAGTGGDRRRGSGQRDLLYALDLRRGADAGTRHSGLSGLRARGSRRVPSLAGAGRVSGVLRFRAHHGGDLAGEPWLHALRDCSRGSRAGERISAAAQLGHVAAAALRRNAALLAGSGPGARDYADVRARESGELVRQLGSDLRQAGVPCAGRKWVGDLDRDFARDHGGSTSGFRVAIRAQPRASIFSGTGLHRRLRGSRGCCSWARLRPGRF